MANKTDKPESAYSDVSKDAEQAKKDAENGPELDEDGKVKSVTSESAVKVADEQAKRAAGAANGGGPWPPELLVERYTGSTALRRDRPVYTSHESDSE